MSRRLTMPDGTTVGLGDVVECRVGRSTPGTGRKMRAERDYKGAKGEVVATHLFEPVDLPDARPPELEVAIEFATRRIAWFTLDQIALVDGIASDGAA